MADDVKKVKDLKQAQDLANKAIEKGNDLTRGFGELLKANLKDAKGINVAIESAAGIIQRQLNDKKSDLSTSDKIKNVVKEKSDIDKKIAHYNSIGHTAIAKKLETQKKGLVADGRSLALEQTREKVMEGLVATAKKLRNALTVTGILTGLVGIAKNFASQLDTVGKQFGSLVNLGPNLTDDLLNSGNEAIKLGQGLAETSAITSDLASNFGVSLDNAVGLSNKILDTAMATGLSNDEATKLFGTLGQVAGLSADQSESLIEGTAQLARQAGVAPQQVLKDIAASSETIAIFTKDSGENLFEAAVAARQFGLNIDSVAKAARSTLDFESSIAAEVEASVMLGKQLNLQKAREAALNKDLVGFQEEIKNQLGDIGDFTELNVFEQESLAKALGYSVSEVAKLASGTQQLSVAGALSSQSFGDLLGQDGISNLTTLINSFKSLGAILVNELGGPLEEVIGKFKDFVQSSGGIAIIKETVIGLAAGIGKLLTNLPTVIGLMVSLKAVSIAAGIAQTILAVTKASAATAIMGGIGGVVVAGVIAAAIASAVSSIPKAQTGISGFSGGSLMVGESGPEIMNVPRGTNVMSAEPTRQLTNQDTKMDISPLVEAANKTTDAITNLQLTAGRGEIRVAMEAPLG
nr:phage tail tape measure protein [uncultured Mediterranean phage uvMED]